MRPLIALTHLIIMCLLTHSAYAKDRLVVLNVKVNRDRNQLVVKPFEAKALTSDLRRVALEYGGFDVMTNENMLELLPPDTRIEDCIGECEVETGRLVGARYLITGEIGRAGRELDLLIQFYETVGGTLISSKNVSARDVKSLRARIRRDAPKLFSKLAMRSALIRQRNETLLFLRIEPPSLKARVKLDARYLDLDDKQIRQQGGGYLIPITPNEKHQLLVSARGYMSAEEELVVGEGGVGNLSVRLAKAVQARAERCKPDDKRCRADLFVYSVPAVARVYVDGKPALDEQGQPVLTEVGNPDRPELGMVRIKLPPGEHIIEVRKPRFVSARRRVTLKRGDWNQELQAKPLRLLEDFGRLIVEVTPRDAVIELDGKMMPRQNPLTLNEVEVGAHKLKLIAPEYLPHEELIVVRRGQDTRVKKQLTPNYSNLHVIVLDQAGAPIKGARVNIDSLGARGVKSTDGEGFTRYERLSAGEVLAQVSHPLYRSMTKKVRSGVGGDRVTLEARLVPNFGYLSVTSKDDVAGVVYLSNGRALGALPLERVKLVAGRHELRFQPRDTERYSPHEQVVTVGLNDEVRVEAPLAPRLGEVVIESKPFGGEVWVAGELWGRTPLKRSVIRGTYAIEVRMKEYDPHRREVTVEEGERAEVKVNLGQNPTLTVRCHPEEASVWVQGLPLGRSPQTHTERPGSWLLECRLGDASIKTQKVMVDGDVKTAHLTISEASLSAVRSKRGWMRTLGWGLIAASGSAVLGAGGVYVGSGASASTDRNAAYESVLQASPTEYDTRYAALLKAEDEVRGYNTMSSALLLSGAGLAVAGGALLWFAPDLDPEALSAEESRARLKARADRATEEVR